MKAREYAVLCELEDRHWWFLGHREVYSVLLDRYCGDHPRGKVLDAGCGTGGFMRFIQERYQPQWLVGVDLSEEALWRCEEKCTAATVRCSVEELPFPDETFDLVISLDVLYHRWVKDDRAALREMARVLKPGGFLLLNLPAFPALKGRHDLAVEGVRRFRAKEVREKLKLEGYDLVRITYTNCFLFPLVAVYRFWSRRDSGADSGPESDLWLPPRWLNRALTRLLRWESHLARHIDLPFGSSLTALAQKGGKRNQPISAAKPEGDLALRGFEGRNL